MPRPHDLPPVDKLARGKPHGHKMRYLAGCRCVHCRYGNAAYERKLEEDRKRLGPNDLVTTGRVRQHLKYLQQFGMGHKTVAKQAGVGKTVLAEILWYGKKQMRRRGEARVLAVQPTLDTLPKNVTVPAAETLARLRQLVSWGYPKTLINRDGLALRGMGLQVQSLRGKSGVVAVKTAVRVRDFFARIEKARQTWQTHYGPVPAGWFVYWKTPQHRDNLKDLKLYPLSRNYDYHHRYSPELKNVIRLANQLKRACRERRHDEKHAGRPA